MTVAPEAAASLALPLSLVVRPRPWLTLADADTDDPASRRLSGHAAERFVQGVLPLTYTVGAGVDATPRGGALTIVREGAADAPSAKPWASRFLQAVVEVVVSDRPLPQLARWTAPDVYETIARAQRATTARRRDPAARTTRPYVASVHVSQIEALTAEVAARVVGGRRSRAVAARLDFERGRWTCTALHLG